MISVNHYDLWANTPTKRDQVVSLAYAISMVSALAGKPPGGQTLPGLMRVVGVPVPNKYVPLLTEIAEQGVSAIPENDRERIEMYLPEDLERVRRKAARIAEVSVLLKSEVRRWEEVPGEAMTCCEHLSTRAGRLALGYAFSLFEKSEGNVPGGNTLVGCIRDAGLEIDNNLYVQLLTQISKQGAKAVPEDIRKDFWQSVLGSIDRIQERWAQIGKRSAELLSIIGMDGDGAD